MENSIIIPRSEIVAAGDLSTAIKGFETVASYNWLERPTPTILVPGIPPLWTHHAVARPLQPDSGPRYVDQNADRTPGSPLQALVLAVKGIRPNFDFQTIDVATDRNPIRKLFSFVSGEEHKPFQFGVTILGTTALFSRNQMGTRDYPAGLHGYRTSFEQEYTRIAESARDSTSHHRIVKYEFGGIRLLLRYAVDAFNMDKAEERLRSDGVKPEYAGPFVNCTKPGFATAPAPTTAAAVAVEVVSGGHQIPHEATLELSTKAKNPRWPFQIEPKSADFWISRTRNFVVAEHSTARNGGTAHFNDIDEMEVEQLVDRWERTNEANLQKLAAVLGKIIKAAKELGGPCVASSEGYNGNREPVLTISKAGEADVPSLPHDLQSLFFKAAAKKEAEAGIKKEEETKVKKEVVAVAEAEETGHGE